MGDDGVGLAALERLRTGWLPAPGVRLLDGGTWGLQLLPDIEEAERLLLLDAIEAGARPGTLVVLEREAIPRFFAHKFSPHEVDLREVLALADLRGRLPRELVAIGVQPGAVTLAPGLSPEVDAGLEAMLLAVAARLEAWGHPMHPAVRHAHA
jgi:hydrogenase maturation protease